MGIVEEFVEIWPNEVCDTNIIISPPQINFGKDWGFAEWFNQVSYSRDWIAIFDSNCIKGSIVHDRS